MKITCLFLSSFTYASPPKNSSDRQSLVLVDCTPLLVRAFYATLKPPPPALHLETLISQGRFGDDLLISIPASGQRKCRTKRPDRRPHSITPGQRYKHLAQRAATIERGYGLRLAVRWITTYALRQTLQSTSAASARLISSRSQFWGKTTKLVLSCRAFGTSIASNPKKFTASPIF